MKLEEIKTPLVKIDLGWMLELLIIIALLKYIIQ